jgi:hypothetical protein
MSLERRSILKLLKDHFSGVSPMSVDPTARDALADEITQRLARIEGVETNVYQRIPDDEKARLVCTFAIIDTHQSRYYYSSRNDFCLVLDEQQRLLIKHTRDGSQAVVSDVDEIVQFVLHCQQRLARRRALQVKREKIRDLKAQAIIAQVKQLAKAERFDFMTDMDSQKLKLFVKLSERHSIELHIPFKQFEQMLPQLRAAIVALGELHASGIRFKIVSRRALPWRQSWVSHKSL